MRNVKSRSSMEREFTPMGLLEEALRKRRAALPAETSRTLTTRRLAREMGIRPSYLSMMIRGQRQIPLKRAVQLSYLLKMNDEDRTRFIQAVAISAAMRGKSGGILRAWLKGPQTRRELVARKKDQKELLRKWYYLAVLDLTTCLDFQPHPGWISERLAITSAQAQNAILALFRLGLVVSKDGTWRKASNHIHVPEGISSASIRQFHAQMITLARKQLTLRAPAEFARRSITSATLAVDPRKYQQAEQAVQRFQEEISGLLTTGDCTEVYQLNVQLFPLTRMQETPCLKR
jgi:uncharacterized protein (TIGR02147 family)